MNTLAVNFKKLSDKAVTPSYSKTGDAGLDLTATSMKETDMYIEYGTDLSFEIPEGYVGYVFPRSSLSNYDLVLSNHVGVIDSGFRGEVKFRFKKVGNFPDGFLATKHFTSTVYKVGDRIGQLIIMPIPKVELIEVGELSQSNRGRGGFGSSGK